MRYTFVSFERKDGEVSHILIAPTWNMPPAGCNTGVAGDLWRMPLPKPAKPGYAPPDAS
jgi:hypothetical protein